MKSECDLQIVWIQFTELNFQYDRLVFWLKQISSSLSSWKDSLKELASTCRFGSPLQEVRLKSWFNQPCYCWLQKAKIKVLGNSNPSGRIFKVQGDSKSQFFLKRSLGEVLVTTGPSNLDFPFRSSRPGLLRTAYDFLPYNFWPGTSSYTLPSNFVLNYGD